MNDITVLLDDLKKTKTIHEANSLIKAISTIDNLLTTTNEKEEFLSFLEKVEESDSKKTTLELKEWGDVQTPKYLIEKVYKILVDLNFNPNIIIEPTSGTGGFILNAPKYFQNLKLIYGVEIQKQHIWTSAYKLIVEGLGKKGQKNSSLLIRLIHDDVFNHNFEFDMINSNDSLLIVGNPPWVTISELSMLNSENVPKRSNIKKFKGIDALTGKSNFDITETIVNKMIKLFSNYEGKIAILCKNSVVRNILKETKNHQLNISNIRALSFNAKEYFGKTCSASLFIADFTPNKSETFCTVANIDAPNTILRKIGWYKDQFVSDIAKYKQNSQLEGQFPFIWRQGIKHDCTSVLELQINEDGQLINKKNEIIKIEEDLVYPLLKGSSLRSFLPRDTTNRLILTQTKLSDDTERIKENFPKTWDYLIKNKNAFTKRKSQIFREKTQFAIFGVGEYVLSPYKVALAGFYKKPLFTLVTPHNGKPVLFDDTCYYMSFQDYIDALFTCTILNSKELLDFLNSIVFIESKRPFTKEILMRINLAQLVNNINFSKIRDIWEANMFTPEIKIAENDYKNYQKKIINLSS